MAGNLFKIVTVIGTVACYLFLGRGIPFILFGGVQFDGLLLLISPVISALVTYALVRNLLLKPSFSAGRKQDSHFDRKYPGMEDGSYKAMSWSVIVVMTIDYIINFIAFLQL